jgi:hypothetical protein
VTLELYAYALRAARPRQLARRASRPVRRRLFPRADRTGLPYPLEDNVELWHSRAFEVRESRPTGALAGFQANYGENVLAAARSGDRGTARAYIDAWLEASPPRVGSAWHPYVVSTRIGNWVAALSLEPELATAHLGESLLRQLKYLQRNVEDDILGNHVIRNARALILGGLSVGDPGAVAQGRRLLQRELPEQVLADGGHYERSPAYHRLVLRDLLEVQRFAPVQDEIERMLDFAAGSSRPDGAPALFNDGGLDIAPDIDLPVPPHGLSIFPATGYVFVRTERVWLAFDCGAPSPPFLPAHAHADALSFQLWIDGCPAVIDPGTSTYEPGQTRRWERGTESHATVAIDGDQFEIWGAFRSGPLPTVRLVEAGLEQLVAEVRLRDGTEITRSLQLLPGSLEIEDRINGSGSHQLVSSIPLALDATVRVSALTGCAVSESRTFAERFGATGEATALVVRASAALPWEGGWRIEWDAG